MERKICRFVMALLLVSMLAPKCAAVADTPAAVMIKKKGYTVSLQLIFSHKNPSRLQRAISLLDWGINGYATGFIVGDGLVMTAYHVVSGDLSIAKKMRLGFGPKDQLEVKAYVNGCQARIIKVDAEADLALLRICGPQKETNAPAFQTTLSQDEKLLLIARPRGAKIVRWGIFSGPYMSGGLAFWSAKIEVHDGYSGSPVYNDKAELVGVFSGYDGTKKLGLISPGIRAQKLLEDYMAHAKP